MNKGILGTTDDLRTKQFYHGTWAELKPGDLIEPNKPPDVGVRDRITTYVYLTTNLDAAIWEAEIEAGEGPGRVYIVEPTGPIEDASDLTNKKFRGNPTKSFRSREALRVTSEITDCQGHSPEAIKAMKDWLEQLKQLGVEAIED